MTIKRVLLSSWFVKKKREKMPADSHLILHRPLDPQNPAFIQREQNFISLVHFSGRFAFFIQALLAFFQLQTPRQWEIPYANLYSSSFVAATLIFSLSFSHPSNSRLCGVIAFLSGSLASTLLLSNLDSPLIEFVFLILWVLLSILVVIHQKVPLNRKETYEKLGQKMKNMFNEAYEKLGEKMKNIKIPRKISSLWSKNEPGLPR